MGLKKSLYRLFGLNGKHGEGSLHDKSPQSRSRDISVHRGYDGSVRSGRAEDPVILEMLEGLVEPQETEGIQSVQPQAELRGGQSHGSSMQQSDLPTEEFQNPLVQGREHYFRNNLAQSQGQQERGNAHGTVSQEHSRPEPQKSFSKDTTPAETDQKRPEERHKREALKSWVKEQDEGLIMSCRDADLLHWLQNYFSRMKGGVDHPAPVPSILHIILSFTGAFTSILCISALHKWATPQTHFDFLVPAFGASAVLIFGSPEGETSQPRNTICGQVISAIVGCVVRIIVKDAIWVSTALGMALALTFMQITRNVHPPGGATAFIAASAPNPLPYGAGFELVLVVFIDALIMVTIGLIVNNISPKVRYPMHWFN